MSDDFSESLSHCDSVIITSWWQDIDLDELLRRKIEEAIGKGKEIIFTEKILKRNIFPHLKGGDFESKTVALESPCYEEAEKAILRVGVPVVFVVGATQNAGKFETSVKLKQKFVSQLCFPSSLTQTDMVNYATGLLTAEPIPQSTTYGRRLFGGEVYAIPQNSSNKELAWEFLKFAISFQNIDENGKAICTAGLCTEGETVDKKEYYELRSGFTFLKRNASEEAWKLMMGKTYTDEIGKKMLKIFEGADTLSNRDPRLFDAMLPLYMDYFDHDLLTAEQCAKQMQEKAELYLQE